MAPFPIISFTDKMCRLRWRPCFCMAACCIFLATCFICGFLAITLKVSVGIFVFWSFTRYVVSSPFSHTLLLIPFRKFQWSAQAVHIRHPRRLCTTFPSRTRSHALPAVSVYLDLAHDSDPSGDSTWYLVFDAIIQCICSGRWRRRRMVRPYWRICCRVPADW